MNLCILSACYEQPKRAALLVESCRQENMPLVLCGGGWWTGDFLEQKIRAARDKMLTVQYSHVLWTDGFDSFLVPGFGAQIQSVYENALFSPPLVLSAEKNCFPDPQKADLYPYTTSPWKYVNAGGWLGERNYLIDVLTRMLELETTKDDQRIWTNWYLNRWLPGSVLDTDCEIFQTMWGAEKNEIVVNQFGQVVNWGSETNPLVIHFNGGSWRDPRDTRMIDMWNELQRKTK